MKKEETTTARTGWKIWLEKTSQSLKKAWKFANEFDLIEKAKNIRIPRSVKIGGLALLLSGKSLNSHAAETGGRSEDRKIDTTEASVTAAPNRSNDAKTIEFSAVFRAYPGKYYNEVCNGSPCWLASTYETNGAGIGKNPSSIATWNDKGGYRGINQISPAHAQKFLKWLGNHEKYKEVYQSLKKGGVGKANWQKTARQHEHQMTEAFEWYMVEVYNQDNFKAVQDIINKSGVKASVRKLHPAVLSLMHQIMVERPASRTAIANKAVKFIETHGGDEASLNSEEFIKTLTRNKSIQTRAIKLLNDTTVDWKTAQFATLVAQAVPGHGDMRSWFEEQAQQKDSVKKKSNANSEKTAQAAKIQPLKLQPLTELLPKAPKELNMQELKIARKLASNNKKEKKQVKAPAKDLIDYRQLKRKKSAGRS